MSIGRKIMSVAVAISVGKNPANTIVMIVPQTPLKSSWIIRILKTFLDMTSRSGFCLEPGEESCHGGDPAGSKGDVD